MSGPSLIDSSGITSLSPVLASCGTKSSFFLCLIDFGWLLEGFWVDLGPKFGGASWGKFCHIFWKKSRMRQRCHVCENLKPKRTKNHCKTESEVEREHQESAHFHDPLGSPCPNGLPSFGGPQATGISGTPTIASTSPPNQTSNQLAEHCRF